MPFVKSSQGCRKVMVSCILPVKPVGDAGSGLQAQLHDCKKGQNYPRTSEITQTEKDRYKKS